MRPKPLIPTRMDTGDLLGRAGRRREAAAGVAKYTALRSRLNRLAR
jgi:hypothetical protein